MASFQCIAAARRACVGRFLPVPLIAGAATLLTTACGSSLGYSTPCSVWVSMNNADQQSTVDALYQTEGAPTPSNSSVADFERRASFYCADPVVNQPTIAGMLDSRAQ